MDSTSTRRPCFLLEEEVGLASIADVENGFSENHHHNLLLSRPLYYSASPRNRSLRNLSSFSSLSYPRSGKLYDGKFEEQPHFLDACFLCKKPLGDNKDIFMYRGDTPFCSEDCRAEQIDIDEEKEKNWNLSASVKAMRKKKEQNEKSSNKTTKTYPFHTGAVAAA